MKRFFLFFFFLFLFLCGSGLILLSFRSNNFNQVLYHLILGGLPFFCSFYFLADFLKERNKKYDVFNGQLIFFDDNRKPRVIHKNEVQSIYFKNPRSAFLVFRLINNEKYEHALPLFGVDFIKTVESWWGEEIGGKIENVSYQRILMYSKLFNKLTKR